MDIKTWKHPYKDHANILLFGQTGTGKSSIINGFFTLLSDNVEVKAKARGFGDQDHVTVDYSYYRLTDFIYMWDTFGWVDDLNYTGEEFMSMLTGSVKNNTRMNNFQAQRVPSLENEIDAVIFVVDDTAHDILKGTKAMKQFFDQAKKSKKTVCVAVTKLDQSDVKIRDETDPRKLQVHLRNSALLKDIRSDLFKYWEDESIYIFPIYNYLSGECHGKEPAREYTLEVLLRHILGNIGKETTIRDLVFDFFEDEKPCETGFKPK